MTDKEIIKGLECCKRDFSMVNCLDCPYNKEKSANCMSFMIDDALDLINRQQAEIERLNNNISAVAITLSNSAKETRAEAIKEFAERLKRLKQMPLITTVDIDNLVKEMVGEDK